MSTRKTADRKCNISFSIRVSGKVMNPSIQFVNACKEH
jgi:hypothetical protein